MTMRNAQDILAAQPKASPAKIREELIERAYALTAAAEQHITERLRYAARHPQAPWMPPADLVEVAVEQLHSGQNAERYLRECEKELDRARQEALDWQKRAEDVGDWQRQAEEARAQIAALEDRVVAEGQRADGWKGKHAALLASDEMLRRVYRTCRGAVAHGNADQREFAYGLCALIAPTWPGIELPPPVELPRTQQKDAQELCAAQVEELNRAYRKIADLEVQVSNWKNQHAQAAAEVTRLLNVASHDRPTAPENEAAKCPRCGSKIRAHVLDGLGFYKCYDAFHSEQTPEQIEAAQLAGLERAERCAQHSRPPMAGQEQG